MATPPVRPTPTPPPATQTKVPVPGIPPRPDMRRDDEQKVGEATAAEQEAGRKATELAKERLKAEQEAGQKLVSEAKTIQRQQEAGRPSRPDLPPLVTRANPLHGHSQE